MSSVASELERIVGAEHVIRSPGREWLCDASVAAGLVGSAEAVVLPGDADEVAGVVAWCYERGVGVVPRGGGTGYAGGAVPAAGEVVLALGRLRDVHVEPEAWRMRVGAGVTTADVRRLARENGLFFGPDPGAAEQSQIGGNVATNAGGPHALKYGVTREWVRGLEAVVAPGDLVRVGGVASKDVAGYDLRALLCGSEGTLGVITSAWLRLVPAPEATRTVVAFYPSLEDGCEAVAQVREAGVRAAALEFFDAVVLGAAGASLPGGRPPHDARFGLLAQADGSQEETAAVFDELREALSDGATEMREGGEELWRWRDGVSLAVTAAHGGKQSEDIVVPVERLGDAVRATVAIGERHRLTGCSWGHAGDGNLHSTFLLDPGDEEQLARARVAAHELFELAAGMGGSVSGEHGLGLLKSGSLARQWDEGALRMHEAVKRALDPRGLMNPGKKAAR